MGRGKAKNGKMATFYLEVDNLKRLQFLATQQGMNMSEYLDWAISAAYHSTDVGNTESELKKKLQEMEEQRTLITEQLGKVREHQLIRVKVDEVRQRRTKQCIDNLTRMTEERRPFAEILEMAQQQALLLKTTPLELLTELERRQKGGT